MHADRSSRRLDRDGGGMRRPRVVILDEGSSARVAVLELPEELSVGASFCHSGISWRVTGTRTSSRVFIAEREH
jgi:hypothetical protein